MIPQQPNNTRILLQQQQQPQFPQQIIQQPIINNPQQLYQHYYQQPTQHQQFPQHFQQPQTTFHQGMTIYQQPHHFQQPQTTFHHHSIPNIQSSLHHSQSPKNDVSILSTPSDQKESVKNQVPGREDLCINWQSCTETKDITHRCSKRHMCTIKDCSKKNDKVHVGRFIHKCKYGEKCRLIDDENHNHNFIHPCKYKEKCTKFGDIMHRVFFTHSIVESAHPSSWEKVSSNDHFKRVKISHSSPEYKAVEKKFLERINHKYPTAIVIDIERVENAKLWKAFTLKRLEVTHKNHNMKAEDQVKTLYHGADESSIDAITKSGFDFRLCKNGHYGAGVYFAINASYSHAFTKQSADGKYRMLVCKVVIGESLRVPQPDRSLRRPQDKNGKLYDSVQGGPTGNEYIIFDNESPYPEYVVIYK